MSHLNKIIVLNLFDLNKVDEKEVEFLEERFSGKAEIIHSGNIGTAARS